MMIILSNEGNETNITLQMECFIRALLQSTSIEFTIGTIRQWYSCSFDKNQVKNEEHTSELR